MTLTQTIAQLETIKRRAEFTRVRYDPLGAAAQSAQMDIEALDVALNLLRGMVTP